MKKRIISSVLLIIGLTIGVLAKLELLTSLDSFVYNSLMNIKCESIPKIFKTITILGNTEFIILLNIIVIGISLIIKNKGVLVITRNSIISPIVNHILKLIYKRPRPDESLRLIKETNYSFPSGHAMISIFFYLTLILFINKSEFKYKKILNIILLLIIILIGISRIYLGVHFFSDILGGYLIGISIVLLLERCEEK